MGAAFHVEVREAALSSGRRARPGGRAGPGGRDRSTAVRRAGDRSPPRRARRSPGSRSAVGSSRTTKGASDERARQRDPPASARGSAAGHIADQGVVAAGSSRELVGAGGERGRLPDPLVGRRVAETDVLGDGPAEQRRRCGSWRGRRPPRRTRATSAPPAVMRPELGSASRSSLAAMVLFPEPLGPRGRRSRRAPARGRPASTRPRQARISERDALEPDGAAQGRARPGGPCGRRRRALRDRASARRTAGRRRSHGTGPRVAERRVSSGARTSAVSPGLEPRPPLGQAPAAVTATSASLAWRRARAPRPKECHS